MAKKITSIDELIKTEKEKIKKLQEKKFNLKFNLTGKKSPTSIGGAMNCPIVF